MDPATSQSDDVKVDILNSDDVHELQREAELFMARAVAPSGWPGESPVKQEPSKMLESLSFSSASSDNHGKGSRRQYWAGLSGVQLLHVPQPHAGPTGCGKTSLLNALAARLPIGGRLEGEVLVNGLPRGRGFRAITAFVQQDDVLFHNLTVRETFDFAAAISLPRTVSAAAKRELTSRVITELGLAKVANSFIGNAFLRGISGGERKRCNIGIQILANPSLIFCDEPTSGLDAFQAQKVMEALWALAHSGRSVMATAHQPRSSIYRMFDLLLLVSEGRTIYFGPASQAVAWFEGCGLPCPPQYNPADLFLDVISPDFRSSQLEEGARRRISLLATAFAKRGDQSVQQAGLQSPTVAHGCDADMQALQEMDRHPGFPNGLLTEFRLLLWRAWKQQSRDRLPQVITIVQTVVIGFVLAALYSNLGNSQTAIQDEVGILFFISIFAAFNALFNALNTFPVDRAVVSRERAGRAHHIAPYYLARFVCDVPLRVGQCLLFGVIVYWIVGLNPSPSAFFIFVALLLLEGLAAQGLGVAVSAACRNEKVALAVGPAVVVILILFGGFYIQKDSIPAVLRWIENLSFLYFAFMGLTINDFSGREGWECDGSSGAGCLQTGDDILNRQAQGLGLAAGNRLGFAGNHLWQAFLGLSCLIAGYNALGYLALRASRPKFLPMSTLRVPNHT
ncbi:hypothetical protein N2152v2_003043 [Parachlorella kessleri]